MEARHLMWQAQIESVITKREGMKAANARNKVVGLSQAYSEGEFRKLIDELQSIIEYIIKYG